MRSIAVALLALACGCAPLQTTSPREEPLAQTPSRVAIRGHIVTPEGVVPNGWIVIESGKIASIGASPPAARSTAVLETDDYVFPAFVDLHNHPMYNMFPRWTPPRQYANRYEWRAAPEYRMAIANPFRELLKKDFCDANQFVEVQQLIGGTGATTGIDRPGPEMPACIAGLVRNLDWYTGFRGTQPGNERVQTLIGVTGDIRDEERARKTAQDLREGRIDALVIHLAEGRASDEATRAEFAVLEKRGFLAPQTVLVHAIALRDEEFRKMARLGASVVWSPRSNIDLYDETLDVTSALRNGVTVALGPDWSPTGSINMLEELRYAAAYSRRVLAGAITGRQLFEMATIVPAKIVKLDEHIGSLAPGKRADLFLVRKSSADAYEALIGASVTDIPMVMIDGVAVYGEAARLQALRVASIEPLTVCGRERALNGKSLPAGSFASATARLAERMTALGVRLGPLADCPP